MSTGPSPAAATASASSRATPFDAVRTFSSGRIRPSCTCRIGFTDSAVPSSACSRADAAAAAQVLQRVDVEERCGALGGVDRGPVDVLERRPGSGGGGGREHREAEPHGRRAGVDDADSVRADLLRGHPGGVPRAGQLPGEVQGDDPGGAAGQDRPVDRRQLRRRRPGRAHRHPGRQGRGDVGRRHAVALDAGPATEHDPQRDNPDRQPVGEAVRQIGRRVGHHHDRPGHGCTVAGVSRGRRSPASAAARPRSGPSARPAPAPPPGPPAPSPAAPRRSRPAARSAAPAPSRRPGRRP